MSAVTDPNSSTGHILSFRATRTGASATGEVQLWSNGAQIATTGVRSIAVQDQWETFSHTLSGAEADAIAGQTGYDTLTVRVISGSVGNNNDLLVTQVQLQVPDAASQPTVTVISVLPGSITDTEATMRGDVTDNGGATVTERGVRWGTQSGGPYPNEVSAVTAGTGGYEVPVTGLPPNDDIFYIAYDTNSAGTSTSESESPPFDEQTFQTLVGLPSVGTSPPNSITATSADLGGDVTSLGGEASVDVGVVWKLSDSWDTGAAPTDPSNGNNVPMGSVITTGTFEGAVDLTSATGSTVYFRGYATNSAGTGFESAILGGEVTGENGAAVTDRGIVWNTTNTWNVSNPPALEGTVWTMGSGPGTFSDTVTGLPSNTVIHYKAYAINSSGTSYSPTIESFTTDQPPEPTVQASNVEVWRFSGRSMRIRWTRGNGEGSIVVLRAQGTTIAHPQDGTDYVPDSNYSAPPESTGAGNFVVYKGAENGVWVTGLAVSTWYSIAVYEYAGTDYLLGPAALDWQTAAFATHNEDLGIDCTDCHRHGVFGQRGDDLKNICTSCHDAASTTAARFKLMFDNHLEPDPNPSGAIVDCGACHDVHLSTVNRFESTNPVTSSV
ncbi:MAG: cytochrome c3 family protein, partial [Planctomycetota bacterium]